MILKFKNYNLSKEVLKAIDRLNYTSPTPVQQKVIPLALKGRDIVVKSQTGSGKTASFAIPICDKVDWDENKAQALVITPTRELAIQVREEFFNIGRFKRLKVSEVYGQFSFRRQQKELKQKTHIVVGTPGRLIDHIERKTIDLSMIKYLVIDEADEMLNMGFIEQIEAIIQNLPKNRITMLLSATIPKDIKNLCKSYMKNYEQIEIEAQNLTVDKITQERYSVEENDKFEFLKDILVVENPDRCMIFCNTKKMVDELCDNLYPWIKSCSKIHGGMEQQDRSLVMNDFRKGKFRHLICTDVAARGIDIEGITHVINYDTPEDKEDYVHRIGRTARASKSGKSITFVTENDIKFIDIIQKYIDKEIEAKQHPDKLTVDERRDDFNTKINTKLNIGPLKSEKVSEGIMKLHINAGKKTKMRPVDIVGTLCNIDGMTAADIGIINIIDVSTFVEILNGKGEMIYNALQGRPIKGRIRKVSKCEQ
ncbi:MAG: DEAD/DEAH box helicase [Tepidibacter sp.]|jgi:superfamily II DNA/RNA helicase|uniref:DEAD/DEAH box helicase n=1 Tax=Tepidibacter sp. TaxID=2529387 RepID=UPI0025D699FB|nr:DEAD/DEAH box helicase [Tepidibacter sp.]MCT4509966.1 DEAD/DEAH box helicase [Tepidibacter sp.]